MLDATALPDLMRSRVLLTECCWLWTGSTYKRYRADGSVVLCGIVGRSRKQGGSVGAARLVLAHVLGRELLSNEWALHACDLALCVRPDHLYLGDAKQNAADRVRRSGRETPCRGGLSMQCSMP